MLEKKLQKGMTANWLPTAEAGVAGTGTEMSAGCVDVDGGIYLPFAANGINYTESQGKDVISFNFTGCIMAAYTTPAGSRRVGHVSTGGGQDCLGEWARIKAASSQVLAFKPHLFADVGAIAKAQKLAVVDLSQDGTRYFDLHHTPDDTLDKIDPAQFAQNVEAWRRVLAIVANEPGALGGS